MKKKKSTIHDIAHELDVTASTVSRALRDHPRISDATKEAVREMAKKLNYQPNNIASALRKGKTNNIGIIVPSADRNFFASVVTGVEEVVNESGYNVIICQSNDSYDKENANIAALLKSQVDGILASIAKETTHFDHYKKVLNNEVPLIFFDRINEDLDVSSVVIDDYLGALKAVEHLIEQGCKNIVHFSGQQHLKIYRDRLRGYKDALIKHNIPIKDELILESPLQLDSGRELAQHLLNMESLPDGIFSSSDFAAMGAIQVLKKKGVAIPKEIAIVGFSNDVFTPYIEPALSTVDQYTKQMGRLAAQLFLEQINADPSAPFTPRKTVLKPELIIRASSKRTA